MQQRFNKFHQAILLLLIFVAAPFVGVAQTAPALKPSAPVTPLAKFEEFRAAGFEALYNLDYEGARKNFNEIKRLYPTHPAGPQWLAATLWAQTLNELRGLQASLYSSDDFYAQGEAKPDPKVAAEFKALTTEAINLAKARLKENPKDVEALYFLGVTKGLKAAYKVGVERSFMGALGDGRDSVGHHEDVLKLDPNFIDAQVSIGLYNYTVASLPPFIKLLAGIGGIRGSKKKSFVLLQDVATKGRWAQDDARSALVLLYKREKRWADALAVTRDMSTKYPRNYLFKLESADSLTQMSAAAKGTPQAADYSREAFAILDTVLRDKNAAKTLDLVHAKYGEALFSAGQYDKAAAEFLAAAATPGAEAALVTGARLRAGQALDLQGKRKEAVDQYNAVLQRPNVMNAHDQAKRGLKEPYKLAQTTATATATDGGE